MIEIERKFLVKSDQFKTEAFSQNRIAQGYLSSLPERTVRIRIKGERGFITIKGIGKQGGMSRFEWENDILLGEAQELLKLCEKGKIEKTNHFLCESPFFQNASGSSIYCFAQKMILICLSYFLFCVGYDIIRL